MQLRLLGVQDLVQQRLLTVCKVTSDENRQRHLDEAGACSKTLRIWTTSVLVWSSPFEAA